MNSKSLHAVIVLWLGFMLSAAQAQELPVANKKVLEFCHQNFKKKVGRGECWDVAAAALDYAKADWERPYNFGDKINRTNTTILPGDIIQFEKVKFKGANGFSSEFPHHTAIVYEVLDKDKIIIIHQNFNGVKKLSTLELNISELTKGSLDFYRPRMN